MFMGQNLILNISILNKGYIKYFRVWQGHELTQDEVNDLYSKRVYGNCPSSNVTIPSTYTSIANHTFYQCSNIQSVAFAATSQVTSIGAYAFGHTNLTTISIPSSVISINSTALSGVDNVVLRVEYGNTMNIATVCSSGSCYGASNVNIVEVDQCPSLGLYQYYLYAGDCDTVSTLFIPSYAWDFRIDSSIGPVDSISGLTSTYENGLTSSMTMGAYFAGGGNSGSSLNYIDLQGFEVGGTCSFEAYVRYDDNGNYARVFDFGDSRDDDNLSLIHI